MNIIHIIIYCLNSTNTDDRYVYTDILAIVLLQTRAKTADYSKT